MASGKQVSVDADDHNAFFYSLVSTDTEVGRCRLTLRTSS
jgi:hypothetical protein